MHVPANTRFMVLCFIKYVEVTRTSPTKCIIYQGVFLKFRTKNHMTKIGAFCSPLFHLKISTSIVIDGARVLEKIGFDFFLKNRKKSVKIRYME